MRGPKLLSRIRSGGVVISRYRLIREAAQERDQCSITNRKLRMVALPHRRAAQAKKR